MATWTKQKNNAKNEAQRRWRHKRKQIQPIDQYWAERRLMNLIIAGIIVPEIEEK